MCLAVPGRIRAVADDAGVRVADVDFGGLRKRVFLETLPQARPGDWILVHAGFALQRLDVRAAEETLRLLGAASAAPPEDP
jgi:hydrogenase expression/formation protein HypC